MIYKIYKSGRSNEVIYVAIDADELKDNKPEDFFDNFDPRYMNIDFVGEILVHGNTETEGHLPYSFKWDAGD